MTWKPWCMSLGVAALLAACGEPAAELEADVRPVPLSQSDAARALRLPRLRPAPVRTATGADPGVRVLVQVVAEGPRAADVVIPARDVDPACDTALVDSLVVRNGRALVQALVWVEGTTAVLSLADAAQHRPRVQLSGCQLQPRLQVAVPGSMLQVLVRDSMRESLVVVPSQSNGAPDTLSAFSMAGQLIPVAHAADSTGVLGVYALRLPWARAYVAVAPPSVAAVSDTSGRASFMLDANGASATIRAWHPAFGVTSAPVVLRPGQRDYTVTLTFRR